MTAVVVHHSPRGTPATRAAIGCGARDRASRGHNPTTPLGVSWAATVGVAVILVLLCGTGGRGERTSFHHCDVSAELGRLSIFFVGGRMAAGEVASS